MASCMPTKCKRESNTPSLIMTLLLKDLCSAWSIVFATIGIRNNSSRFNMDCVFSLIAIAFAATSLIVLKKTSDGVEESAEARRATFLF